MQVVDSKDKENRVLHFLPTSSEPRTGSYGHRTSQFCYSATKSQTRWDKSMCDNCLCKTDSVKGDKPKIQLCGFQSNLFMKIYPVRQTVLLCVFVLINRHQEDVTRSSFNKSEFSFTTWYCTRSSAETDFFLTDLSLKKSHRYCEFCINWWTVS